VPPKFGQHTREVLSEFGYRSDEIGELVASGAVCGAERKR
jgi:formyl-CoA transferase